MTIRETAEVLGLKVRTIRKWIADGTITATKGTKKWDIPEEVVYSEEVQERANKNRKHPERVEEGKPVGVLAGRSEDPEESVQRAECEVERQEDVGDI